MERRILAGAFLFAGMIWLSPARPARADVDVSGCWVVRAFIDQCFLQFSLSGAEVTATGSCSLSGAVVASDTFDAASGQLSISGSAEKVCETFKVDATVAPEGTSFVGTVDCEGPTPTLELTGSLNGDGLLCATHDALREAIEQALADYRLLGLHGLLLPGAISFGFAAPSSGTLEVRLEKVPRAQFLFVPVLVARGRAEIESPGQVVVQLRLTRRGRQLLRRRKRLMLALQATFMGPSGTVAEPGSVTVVVRQLALPPPKVPHS
jgi:hypothetical protein